MILHLRIQDFAIIENLEVDFHDGLNIITGETGAGKSIIIEAVSLALGARADSSYVRTGKDKAVIQLIADHENEEVIITREISAEGRNICRINGQIVTLGEVQALCHEIADIHGQYDHQSLLNPDYHIQLVDTFGKEEIRPAKAAVSDCYSAYASVSSELSSLLKNFRDMQRQKDFMAFELNELSSAGLRPGEDEELEEKISLLQNSEKIFSALENAYALLYGGEMNAASALDRSVHLLNTVSSYSREVKDAEDILTELSYSMEDAVEIIRDVKEKAQFDPGELDIAMERLDLIDGLKRKHGMTIEEMLEYMERLTKDLAVVENIDDEKLRLEKEKQALEMELKEKSGVLSSLRKEAAQKLQKQILSELKELNFKDAELLIDFRDSENYTSDGTDIVEFMMTTNKGEALKPLAKIASGGEMSRIMLAFKKIVGDYDQIPTMIFDEIDTGISGITASIVGKKLSKIAQNHQIICITHLPQIAAAGMHHFLIQKNVSEDKTYTDVIPLDEQGKIQEIARLLGGANITETTLRSAEELIQSSKEIE